MLGKMSRIQQEISYHPKNQENHNLNAKSHVMDTNTHVNQTLELPDKDFKEGIIKILQQPIPRSLETSEKWENRNEEIEVTEKNQMEITELKNTTAEIKKLLAGIVEMTG